MSLHNWLRYKWLKTQLFIVFNFGRGDFGCIQFFRLRLVPKKNTEGLAATAKHFHSYYCWTLGTYFIVFDERTLYERE